MISRQMCAPRRALAVKGAPQIGQLLDGGGWFPIMGGGGVRGIERGQWVVFYDVVVVAKGIVG
jgi:hypothetical protein